jgi:hypothetical protein
MYLRISKRQEECKRVHKTEESIEPYVVGSLKKVETNANSSRLRNSESHKNYQNESVSNQLTDVRGGGARGDNEYDNYNYT